MLRVAAHRVAGCVASLLSDDEVAVRAAALTTLLELGAGAEPYLRAAEVMVAKLPRAERLTIPGAGHIVNIEAADVFDAAVIGFLGNLSER